MVRVLYDYGYAVNPDGGDREQQFQCDLHGDGRDGKPSGRVYPSSNSMYCFACGRARDAVALAMEKEGLSFGDALTKLEGRYGLPPLPDSLTDLDDVHEPTLAELFAEQPTSYTDAQARADLFLKRITSARALPMLDILQLWQEFDRVQHGVAREGWSDGQAAAAIDRVRLTARMSVGVEH
jgi:DNA primase